MAKAKIKKQNQTTSENTGQKYIYPTRYVFPSSPV